MPNRFESDMNRELDFHIEQATAGYIAQGLSPTEARRRARMDFGAVDLAKEELRDTLPLRWLDDLAQDLYYALRSLRTNPGFVTLAVFSLALGIGANTALFSTVKRLLIETLPYRDASRLVYVTEFWPHEPIVPGPPAPDFGTWRANSKLVDGIAAYGGGADTLNLTGTGEPERIQGTMVSASLLDLLGTHMAVGRNFSADEDRPGQPPVVVLGYGVWQRKFGGSPAVVGEQIRLNGTSRTIVGVLPSGFSFPDNNFKHDLLVPMTLAADLSWRNQRDFRLLRIMARLKPGVTAAALQQEFAALLRANAKTEPPQMVTMRKDLEVRVIPLREWLTGPIRQLLVMLESAVALLLLLACVNIASLQLARGTARQQELAVRAAIGASRGRIVRQLMTESFLLSASGAALGIVLGYVSLPALRAFLPVNLHLADGIRMDSAVLAFSAALALVTGVLSGAVPALVTSKPGLQLSKYAGRQWLQNSLVVCEVTIAMVLLIGSALFVRTFTRVSSIDAGFQPGGVLSLRVSLPPRYPDAQAWTLFFTQLVDRAAKIPGVDAAAVGGGLPLIGTRSTGGLAIEGQPDAPLGGRPIVPLMGASVDYFRVLNIPIFRGRSFQTADERGAPVVIVNQAFAETYFPGRDALGKRIEIASREGRWREIIGIAGNVRQQGRRSVDSFLVYAPITQMSEPEAILVLKSSLPPSQLVAAAAAAVHEGDKNLPVFDVATMEERLSLAVAPQRANMTLLSALGSLSLVIAATGVFGVLAFFVSRRTHEMAIRQAVGARPVQIARLVLLRGMAATILGIGLGLAIAAGLSNYVGSLLEGIPPLDYVSYSAAVAIFLIVGLAACILPVRRATQVDPAIALRHD